MRPKSLILLSLALGCGLVASLGINQVMSRGTPAATPSSDTEMIYVAAKEISPNELIDPSTMVKLEAWPKDKVPPGAITRLEDLQDRRTRHELFAGEPLLDKKLLPKGEASKRETDLIPPGYRVVAVKVDAVSTGGNLLKPNDRVDLLVHLVKNLSKGIDRSATFTFLQDVKVFAVNSDIKEDGKDGRIAAKTVSLLLTPEEAEIVTFASNLGRITLSLRPTGDASTVATKGGDIRDLLGGDDSSRHNEEQAGHARSGNADPEPGSSNPLLALLQGRLGSLGSVDPRNPPLEAPLPGPDSTEPFITTVIRGETIEEYETVLGALARRRAAASAASPAAAPTVSLDELFAPQPGPSSNEPPTAIDGDTDVGSSLDDDTAFQRFREE
jgi:pilus assembly protein CpaB